MDVYPRLLSVGKAKKKKTKLKKRKKGMFMNTPAQSSRVELHYLTKRKKEFGEANLFLV